MGLALGYGAVGVALGELVRAEHGDQSQDASGFARVQSPRVLSVQVRTSD